MKAVAQFLSAFSRSRSFTCSALPQQRNAVPLVLSEKQIPSVEFSLIPFTISFSSVLFESSTLAGKRRKYLKSVLKLRSVFEQ